MESKHYDEIKQRQAEDYPLDSHNQTEHYLHFRIITILEQFDLSHIL
jgi:hypothetical protein